MRKNFKLIVALCTLLFALAIWASAATDFTGYTAISSADDLLALMNSTSAVTGKYYLTNDIDLTGKTQSPIGEPSGKSFGLASEPTTVFDGNGYTVKGVNISGGAYIGFFGVVDNAEIRNLTISGKVSSSSSNVGGLVAYGKTKLIIENCTNNCSVTVSSKGVNVGGILGSTEVASMVNLKVSGCVNNGAISAYRVVGGLIGVVQRAKDSTVLIEKCVNNGSVSATCESTASTDYTKVGGILGASNKGETTVNVTSFKITKCLNTGEVKGFFFIGGIVGEFVGTDTGTTNLYENAKFHVTECMNAGNVISTRGGDSGGSRCGGIFGTVAGIGNVTDCLNVGTITASRHHVGGLFGYAETFLGAKNNLNRAQIVLSGNEKNNDSKYVNSIGGYMPTKPYGVNYYTGAIQGQEWVHANGAKSTQYTTAAFNTLNNSGNWTNAEEPILVEFQYLACKHDNVEFTQSGNSIVFTCASCEEVLYTDTSVLTEVYVDYDNGILAAAGKDMGASTAPFKSIEEAFNYVAIAAEIKDTDAKINIIGKAVLADTFETPKTDKTVTVSGGNFHFGGTLIANRHLNLGGPMVFENVKFTAAATEARINAQNNKLVMGEGIVMANSSSTAKPTTEMPFAVNNVKMFVSGGFYDNIPSTMATDVTIRSGEYYIVSGFNATNSTDATTGTAKLTVGKTKASDTLKICDLVAFSTVAQTRLTADSTATIIIDGVADIGRLMMSEREKTTNNVEVNYITNVVLRGTISESYREVYRAPYGFDITGGSHTETSLGYHTFNVYTDSRVEGAVLAEHAFFGGDGYTADDTLVSGGYKPVSDGGDTTLTKHSYMEYCVNFLGGHLDGDDADELCDECGAKANCEHENAEYTEISQSNCTDHGYATNYCGDCGVMIWEGETELDSTAHIYEWKATDNGYSYECIYNSAHVYCTYNQAVTEFYVSDNGKVDGGFSASYPSNDFDTVMRLAAASEEDATVYVVGTITLKNNSETSYEIYIEPEHSNTVTIRGVGKNVGSIKIGTRNARMEYLLSGDTVFEQIEFDTGVSKNTMYVVARHNRLVMGDNISTTFGRQESSANNLGKLVVIGGCDNMADKSTCSKKDTDVTIKSGVYYMVISGSSSKACGLKNGTINMQVLGDITVGGVVVERNGYIDRQFILGSHSANAGDVVFTLDGVVSCVNAFCVGSYGTYTLNSQTVCRTVSNVTINVKSGTVYDYSFSGRSDRAYIYDEEFALTYDPTANQLNVADLVIFPLGNSHSHAIRGGVMNFIGSLNVNYNAKDDAAVTFAKRLSLSLGGSDNFHMNAITNRLCTSASGRHTPSGDANVILDATCRGEGSVEYTCATCHKKYTETIDRLAHNYSDEVIFKEATCVSGAVYMTVCENEDCGHRKYTSATAPTGVHSFDENGVCGGCGATKQALCTHENLGEEVEIVSGCGTGTKRVCLDCEKEFITVDGANHKFGKFTVTVEATDSTPGVKSRVCRACGKVETALIHAQGNIANEAVATNADGSLSDVSVDSLKLTSAQKLALNALLQNDAYGSEVKVSYSASSTEASITYSIPLPAEYENMRNIKIAVKDDEGKLHIVDFKIEKGYIVFVF